MPNWTSNTVYAAGKPADLRAFLEAVKWEDELFDFNRLIPMPEILRHTGSGSRTIDGQDVTSWYIIASGDGDPSKESVRNFTPEELAVLADIGHDDWYSWSIENWGTKWNACSARIDTAGLETGSIEVGFDTAWSAPLPIFHKMHEMFPYLTLKCEWSYEDDRYEQIHTLTFAAAA